MQSLALLLLGAVLVAAVTAHGPPAEVMQTIMTCKTNFPIEEASIQNLHRKGMLLDENDENSRCYVQCMMTKIGSMVDSSGNFDVSAAKQNLQKHPVLFGPPRSPRPSKEKIQEVVDQCSQTAAGEGKCMTNYKIWTCCYSKFHA
ncbi:hypothetical protein B566_EDAN008339 [Ephemera danica]|nr:hypothetical protein B566_EDAN008339 [Ephemera danica]